jgi:hypothetical protein
MLLDGARQRLELVTAMHRSLGDWLLMTAGWTLDGQKVLAFLNRKLGSHLERTAKIDRNVPIAVCRRIGAFAVFFDRFGLHQCGCIHARRYCNHSKTDEQHDGSKDSASHRDRVDVAVADGGQCCNSPPETVKNGLESVWLSFFLEVVDCLPAPEPGASEPMAPRAAAFRADV